LKEPVTPIDSHGCVHSISAGYRCSASSKMLAWLAFAAVGGGSVTTGGGGGVDGASVLSLMVPRTEGVVPQEASDLFLVLRRLVGMRL